jgi:hypothetical protein
MSVVEVKRHETTESQIDRKSEGLLGRIATGQASEEDVNLYRQLSADRANRMIKPAPRVSHK